MVGLGTGTGAGTVTIPSSEEPDVGGVEAGGGHVCSYPMVQGSFVKHYRAGSFNQVTRHR